jgi:hypothetical protein
MNTWGLPSELKQGACAAPVRQHINGVPCQFPVPPCHRRYNSSALRLDRAWLRSQS